MINKNVLVFVLAASSGQGINAFSPCVKPLRQPRILLTALFESSLPAEKQIEATDDVTTDISPEQGKLIMDIPPAPVNVEKPKPVVAKKPKKKGNAHKEGVFSPIVVAAGTILGDDQLKKVRAKTIAIHSDLIKSFVDTSDSAFGKAVLKELFNLADTDNSGYLDKSEVAVALNMLGFKWLEEKQVAKIFERADENGDTEISLEEFLDEAPKTLKVNLIKLAKSNGDDMGLLV